MKSIRISEQTHARLVNLKFGMDTIDDVIQSLLKYREQYLDKLLKENHVRASVEADRAKGG